MEIKNKPVFTFVKGNTPPKDWTVTFSCDNPKQVVVLHIPFEDLSTVAHLFNTFLNENGVKSYIEEQTGTTTVN